MHTVEKNKQTKKQRICPAPFSKHEEVAISSCPTKAYVSGYYNLFVAHHTETIIDKRNMWKMDMQEDIDEEDWN